MNMDSMGPYRCLSSHMTSTLLTWRNKEGKDSKWTTQVPGENDEYWGEPPVDSQIDWGHTLRKITAEIPVCILLVTSLVETATYFVFTSATFFISFSKPQPYEISKKLLASSIFTIGWTAKSLYRNLFEKNLLTHESFERVQACVVSGKLQLPYRYEDASFIYQTDIRTCEVNDFRIHNVLKIWDDFDQHIHRFTKLITKAIDESRGTLTAKPEPDCELDLMAEVLKLMISNQDSDTNEIALLKPETQRMLISYRDQISQDKESREEFEREAKLREIAAVELEGGESILKEAVKQYASNKLREVTFDFMFKVRKNAFSRDQQIFSRSDSDIRFYLTTYIILNIVSHLSQNEDMNRESTVRSFSIFKVETREAILELLRGGPISIEDQKEEIQRDFALTNFFGIPVNELFHAIRGIAERELYNHSLIALIPIKVLRYSH